MRPWRHRAALFCLALLAPAAADVIPERAAAGAGEWGAGAWGQDFPALDSTTGESSEECGTSESEDAASDTRARHIVWSAATVASLADSALAQVPGVASIGVVPTIQAAMVYGIGNQYGCHLDRAHALTIVTYLLSHQVKKTMFKEIVGYIPFAGNLIKGSITWFMTAGIGETALRNLRCRSGSQDLLQRARALQNDTEEGEDDSEEAGGFDSFHTFSDYLVNQDLTPERFMQMIKQAFVSPGREELMDKVERAAEPGELVRLIREQVRYLEVVSAALEALERRFPQPGACEAVVFVADRLWDRGTVEARLASAPYLLHCAADAPPETRRALARSTARLILDTHGGRHGGVPLPLLGLAARLLERTVEEVGASEAEAAGSGGGLDEDGGLDIPRGAWAVAAVEDAPATAQALLELLLQGEGAACGALRALLASRSTGPPSAAPAPWCGVRHLVRLDRLDPPRGAERCIPLLRADMRGQLELDAVPPGAEWPEEHAGGGARALKAIHSGSGLEAALAKIVGQRCMVDKLAGIAKMKHKGLWRNDMPLVLLLTGPSGTGKTMLAKQLAEVFLGRPIAELVSAGRFKTFHMNVFNQAEMVNSFLGPPRGIQGTGDLPDLIRQWPDAVVLLDEVEKAHPSFSKALLKVFGEDGAVYDPRTGKDFSTAKVTFILTSNLGKDLIMRHPQALAKQADHNCSGYTQIQNDLRRAMEQPRTDGRLNFFMESELRSRLTEVLPFLPFSPIEVEIAVRRFLSQEAKAFAQADGAHRVQLAWEGSVVPAFAADYGRHPEEGLRRVQVQLQRAVREALEAAFDAGLLEGSAGALLRVAPEVGVGEAPRLDVRALGAQARPPLPGSGAASATPAAGPDSRWAWAAAGLGGGPPRPGRAGLLAGDGGSLAGAVASWGEQVREVVYEWSSEWDLEILWQCLVEFLWEWRWPLVVLSAMTFVGPVFTTVQPSSGIAALGATTAIPAAGASAASGCVGALARAAVTAVTVLQFAGSAGTVAVPVFTAAYAWQYRHWIGCAIWAAVAVVVAPGVLRVMYSHYAAAQCPPGERHPPAQRRASTWPVAARPRAPLQQSQPRARRALTQEATAQPRPCARAPPRAVATPQAASAPRAAGTPGSAAADFPEDVFDREPTKQ